MLQIRKKQLAAMVSFENENNGYLETLTDTIRTAYPEIAQKIGLAAMRQRIRKGAAQAAAHGIERPANVVRYLHLMFVLDREDFDTAAETGWAGTILGWEGSDENLKLAALEKRARTEQLKAMAS